MLREKPQTKLTKEQLYALLLLSIGNLLDQFDKTLHIHISTLIDSLFFPTVNSWIKDFIPAFSFFSAYFFAPMGAVFFGYMGDIFGRKIAVIINSFVTCGCCLLAAFLPTYAQIGITATVILTLCRILQSMSGLSEVNGAEIYLTESVKPPIQYPVVALIYAAAGLGSMLALAIAVLFTQTNILPQELKNHAWRFCFLVGAMIGVMGAIARRSLKEAGEFADRQKSLKEQFAKANLEWSKNNPSINPKIPLETSLSYFFIVWCRPICFYFIFVHCGELLAKKFEFSRSQIVANNLLPAIITTLVPLLVSYLSYRIHPFRIIQFKVIFFTLCVFAFPFCLDTFHSPKTILLFQCIFVTLRFDYAPATPILIKYFPVLKRFRYAGILGALATSVASIVSPVGMIFLTNKFGNKGILFFLFPVAILFLFSVGYFSKKEAEEKNRFIAQQRSPFARQNSSYTGHL
jgi:MHS family proline/betaine transporter-like MFS transporter